MQAGHDGLGVRWVLSRNRSLSPAQLLRFYLSICGVSLAIAAAFAWHGATVVLAFAGLEMVALGAGFLVYARHATDTDTVTLAGQTLAVEQIDGGKSHCESFRAEWVSVEPAHGDGSLIEISGQGRRMRVGRFLRPEHRTAFARELRTALRMARDAGLSRPDPDQPV
jgi:uncharacterized membrane protein